MKKIKYAILSVLTVFSSFVLFSQSKPFRIFASPVITAIPDTTCSGSNVLLYVSGISGATYSWSPGGATTDSINVNQIATTTYTVTIIQGSNQYTDSITVITIAPITVSLSSSYDTICPMGAVILTARANGGKATYKWNTGVTTSTIVVTPSVSTTYTVTVYGVCDSIRETLRITVVPLPSPVVSGTSRVCKGRPDTLSVNGGTAYIWNNGSTRNKYFTGPIDADSTIYVTAYNALGCAITDTFKITAEICTGIDEIQNPYQFQICPNPNKGIFTVICHSYPSAGEEKSLLAVEIYNVLGEMVHKENLRTTQGDNLITIMEQPSGVYFYRLVGGDETIFVSGKFVIE